MISYVKGKIEECGEDYIIVDNNGIGYTIYMPVTEIEKVKGKDSIVKVHTYQYVREDAIGLFGFLDKDSLNMFKMLINVSGVGPKGALSILSSISPSNIVISIISDDVKTLCKAQGVGKKIAQRIILELKDKFKNYDLTLPKEEIFESQDEGFEVLGALMSLGYTRQEAAGALSHIDKTTGIEDMVKQALRVLMKG